MGKEKEGEMEFYYKTIIDEIDLDVDLSTPAAVATVKTFDYIARVRLIYTVSDAAILVATEPGWTGLQLRFGGKVIFTFKNIVDLYTIGEVITYEDDDNIRTFHCTLDFTKLTPGGLGLQMEQVEGKKKFDFYGQDDMTGATRFRAVVEGYRLS
nr:MAG: hypothetical protein [uncultured archaeon]